MPRETVPDDGLTPRVDVIVQGVSDAVVTAIVYPPDAGPAGTVSLRLVSPGFLVTFLDKPDVLAQLVTDAAAAVGRLR